MVLYLPRILPLKQKAYVYMQFVGEKADVLEFLNVRHRTSTMYTLFVGQSFIYSKFPGRINSLRLRAGTGAYQESGFDLDAPDAKKGSIKSNNGKGNQKERSITVTEFNDSVGGEGEQFNLVAKGQKIEKKEEARLYDFQNTFQKIIDEDKEEFMKM